MVGLRRGDGDGGYHFAPVKFIKGSLLAKEWLMGNRYPRSLYFQKSFESGRSKALEMKCESNCECQLLAGTNDRFPVVEPSRLERMRGGSKDFGLAQALVKQSSAFPSFPSTRKRDSAN